MIGVVGAERRIIGVPAAATLGDVKSSWLRFSGKTAAATLCWCCGFFCFMALSLNYSPEEIAAANLLWVTFCSWNGDGGVVKCAG